MIGTKREVRGVVRKCEARALKTRKGKKAMRAIPRFSRRPTKTSTFLSAGTGLLAL